MLTDKCTIFLVTDGNSPAPPVRRRAALANPGFRKFWISATVSGIGNTLIPVTQALAVLRLGGGSVALGVVLASGAITQVLLLPIGGVWSDRVSRKTLIVSTDGISGLLYCFMGLLLFTGNARVWQFIVLSVLTAILTAFYRPAISGLVAQLVPKSELQSANALISLSGGAPRLIGPAIAGILATVAGPSWAFLIDGISFFAAIALISSVQAVALDSAPAGRKAFWKEFTAGAREITAPWIWQNLLAHGVWNLGFCTLFVVGPAILIGHGRVADWAAVATGLALGSVGGAALALRVKAKRPLVVGGLALLPGAMPFIALIIGVPAWGIVICAVLAAAGVDVVNALWSATLQARVGADKIGKVSSYDLMISLCTTPVSYLAAGIMLRSFGATTILVVSIVLIVIPASLVSLSRSIRAVRSPSAEATEVQVGVDADELS